MKRDLTALAEQTFDVVIVGAGIFGACAAWDAALRGLSVALIERDDFCNGSSANSFKMVHGGIRYIQHLDAVRVRSSCHERSAMLRVAPHLVTPLPIAIPTYGYGMSGKFVLGTGMYLYDTLTADRNRGIADPARHIPWTQLLGRDEVRRLFPDLPEQGLTGAAVFNDAQMYNPTRLVLAFVQSAAERGATVANYTQATEILLDGSRAVGVTAEDRLSGDSFRINARTILSAAGPWTEGLLDRDDRTRLPAPSTYSRDACFLVPRRFDHPMAVAVLGATKDPDALMSRPARHLFVVPWRDWSLIGVWHRIVPPVPDEAELSAAELETFIEEMNGAYPALSLSLGEITRCNFGLVPFGENESGAQDLSYGKRSRLIDHANTHGIENLVSLTGIRYTMGRGDAALAMQMIARKLRADGPPPRTDEIPVHGGDFGRFEHLVDQVASHPRARLDQHTSRCLAHNHGSGALRLLESAPAPDLIPLPGSTVLRAEVTHAIDAEMAVSLTDIVMRRTDLGTGSRPAPEALKACAAVAASKAGWSDEETQRQIGQVEALYPGFTAR